MRVVEAYRLDRYDNPLRRSARSSFRVVEAYHLDRYDNSKDPSLRLLPTFVVEAYRLDRYDNFHDVV